jgi:hypothetical protein
VSTPPDDWSGGMSSREHFTNCSSNWWGMNLDYYHITKKPAMNIGKTGRETESDPILTLKAFLERESMDRSTSERLSDVGRAALEGRKRIARQLLLIACLEQAGQTTETAEASLRELLLMQLQIENDI